MYEKVITVEKGENVNKVYYRDKLIGVYIDGDTKSVADIIDLSIDECLDRKTKNFEEKFYPLLEKLMNECYTAGYNRRPVKQQGFLKDIADMFW